MKLFQFSVQEVKAFQTIDELEAFLLKHGENIVDLMGGEIDRIEMKLRVSLNDFLSTFFVPTAFFFRSQKKIPQIRHCDLEIL